MSAATEYLPRPGEFDPLIGDAPAAAPMKERVRLVRFFKPSELKAYEPPPKNAR